jgi:hypothetical protein
VIKGGVKIWSKLSKCGPIQSIFSCGNSIQNQDIATIITKRNFLIFFVVEILCGSA